MVKSMYDAYGREINYMRISITDRCSLRCRYCMPEEIVYSEKTDLLTFEEIETVCREAVSLGITRFKVTGGEPLLREGCPELIHRIRTIPGVEQVTLTTNGVLLDRYLGDLIEAGVDGINISLDTLDAKTYAMITGRDVYEQVFTGLRTAIAAGISVKINCVLLKGINETAYRELVRFTKHHEVHVRFIELMPIGTGKGSIGISNTWLIEQIKQLYPDMQKDETIHGNGPAVYYHIPGFLGSIGFISAIHGRFCSSCNRIRLTADGSLKPCLCYDTHRQLRQALRAGQSGQLKEMLRWAVLHKPAQHCFETAEAVTEEKKMVQIGG